MKKRIFLLLVLMVMLLLFTGCMPGDGSYVDGHYATIFSGIWHGWIAPLSLLRGFFNHNIHLYESYNTGWWYDLGFYMAIISGFGGLSFYRKKKKD